MTTKGLKRGLTAAGVTLVALAISTAAWAQNNFYRELVKDGRVHVFTQMAKFETFEKAGEMGVGISRLGYGPNGETVIFDSEDAINLYNFKHDKPGEVFAQPKPAPKPKMVVAWKDGKTTFETDNASLSLSNRVQFRYTREMPDDDTTLGLGAPVSGTAQPRTKGDARDSFRVRRAKMKLEGWFWKKELTYEFQMNFADTASSLEDAQLTWDVSKKKTFQIKLGQYKVPFGRQELTSSGSQQFVDRSIVSNEFAKGRDVGVSVQGLLANQKIDYRLGVFNGNLRNKAANDNNKLQYNGRVTFQPWGDVKYSESDFESNAKPLLAVGAQFEVNDLRDATTAVDAKRTIYSPDLSFKYKGFSLLTELFMREIQPEPATAGATATKYDSDGYLVQAGMFLYKRQWEIAARYASWDPSSLKDDDDRTEIGGALNYFANKHSLKVQADLRQIEDKAKGVKDMEFRLQTQFIF